MGEIMDIIGSINTRFLSKSEQSKNEIFNKKNYRALRVRFCGKFRFIPGNPAAPDRFAIWQFWCKLFVG